MFSIRFVEIGNDFVVRVAPDALVLEVAEKAWEESAIPYWQQVWEWSRRRNEDAFEPKFFLYNTVREVGLADGDTVQLLSSEQNTNIYWQMALLAANRPAVRRLIELEIPLPRDWIENCMAKGNRRVSKEREEMLESIFESMVNGFFDPEIENRVLAGEIEAAILRLRQNYSVPEEMRERLAEMGHYPSHLLM